MEIKIEFRVIAAEKRRSTKVVNVDPSSRWTVRLLIEEVVKRKLVPRVERETIRVLLEGHDLQPWRYWMSNISGHGGHFGCLRKAA